MSVKLLENTSFNLIRVNPKLSTNVKLVVDTKGGLFLESFDANEELSKSRYKAFRVSSNTSYEYDLARFYKDTPSNIIFDIKRDNTDISVLNEFGKQYEFNYFLGAEYVDSLSYEEEFGILSPLWLEKNIPDYFIIFRVDGPTSFNNVDADSENQNIELAKDPDSFFENILKNSIIIKTFDLTEKSEIGRYIRKYRNSERFPESPILFNFERNEPTYWNGIDLKQGGFTSKPEFIYDNFLGKDNTILEDEFFLTQGFERNNIACANILNLYFLFNDKDAKDFTINRYFGLYVNEIEEGTFQVSGQDMFIDSVNEDQFPKPKDSNFLVKENTKDLIQTNKSGILVYIDKKSVKSKYKANLDTDGDSIIDLFDHHFLPTDVEVSSLKSIFYIKDKLNNFYNLKTGGTWKSGSELRLKTNHINWKNFTGVQDPILTEFSRVTDKRGKACSFIKINSPIPHGDRYITGLVKKQIYLFSIDSFSVGNTITITDDSSNTFSVNIVNSNILDILQDLKQAWKNQTNGKFPDYSVSIKNNKLVAFEKNYSGVDVNFSISIDDTSSEVSVVKDVGSNFENLIITADAYSSIPIGQASGLFFNPNGTNQEIAKAMASAFNNIKDRFFEATAVNDLVVLVARNPGSRFNDICVGRDLTFLGNHTEIISNQPAFIHPEFDLFFYEGGNNEPGSRVFIDIERFNDFALPNRFLKTIDKTGQETGLSPIRKVSYYIDEPVKDKNGNIISYKNIDKYCTLIVDDGEIIFRDSIKNIYLYELFRIPFGRFSIFPIKDMDVDYFSTEYGDKKELNIEKQYYNTFNKNSSNSDDLTQEDIEDFYSNKNFSALQGQLESEDLSEIKDVTIESEYDRLNENYIKELSVNSRIVPYINKWVYRNGKDCREHDYRLLSSESLGITNFSPSADEFSRDPVYFTHEWYYLQKLPWYFGKFDKSSLNSVFSYFPDKIDVTGSGIYSVNEDYFTEYFTVDYLKYPILDTSAQIVVDEEIVPVKKQLRYSIFEDGSDSNFSTAFFRGVKVIVKERIENNTPLNYNLQSIKFKKSNRFNGYKFSAVLVPHNGEYPDGIKRKNIDIEFIENRKFKNITLIIYVRIDDLLNKVKLSDSNSIIDIDSDFIDRTILYALNSKFISINVSDLNPDLTMDYEDILLSGAIDMRYPASNFSTADIGGVKNNLGEPTKFLDEIILNKYGSYNQIEATSGSETRIFQVASVLSDDHFKSSSITGGPQPVGLTDIQVKTGTYIYKQGGYMYWNQKLTNVSYASIANLVNNGDPSIKYITVLEDGSIVNNLFVIELQTANPVIKPTYIKSVIDDNKPVIFNLVDNIGYKLQITERASVQPIYRHSGKYQPKFVDIIDFEDPYIADSFVNPDSRNSQIKKLLRDKNTQFRINSNFGLIKNLYYHKINDTNSDILELSKTDSFKPLYPLIDETAIDKKDFYIFSSNWDPGYFNRYISKSISQPVIGTRSMIEQKSMFGSKIMKIIDEFKSETFNPIEANSELELERIGTEILKPDNPYHLVYYNKSNQIIIDIYLEKRIIEILADLGIREYFKKFIKTDFSSGSLNTLEDDVVDYIKNNILSRYKIGQIELYVNKSKDNNLNNSTPVLNSLISDINKNLIGMKVVKDFNFTSLSTKSNFNIRVIYNKTGGYYYSFGPSIKIIKK